jgi:hypothetical protein
VKQLQIDMKKHVLIAFALGLCLTASVMAQVPSYVPTNGLVGYWPFNGNANDESGNGNNGTVNGATLTTDRFGVANKAYSFDGGAFISISNSLISNNDNRTISFWIKTSFGEQIPISIGTAQYNSCFNVCLNCSGFYQGNSVSSPFGVVGVMGYDNDFFPANGTNVSNDFWNNVCVVYDGNNTKVFINGLIDNVLALQYNTFGNDNFFGKSNDNGALRFLIGDLDDIGIWNRPLTPQEVSDLYNSTVCVNNLTISPNSNALQIGNLANFTATTSDANSTFSWQSDFGQGFQNLNNYGNYSGTNTSNLSIANVQLANHNQSIRAISTSSNCTDTSNIATIQITDTCITNVTVYDTLIINTTLSLPAPNNENTILIYPNPASDHITIDNGNYTAMTGYTIKIENNAGQQVFQSLINQAQFYVDLSTWTGNGLYFVHLIDPQNNTVTVRKIVLQ